MFKSVRYSGSAVGVLLYLSLGVMAQDASQPAEPKVLTPFGLRDRSTVHEVPKDYQLERMDDGHIRMHNPITGDYQDFEEAPVTAQSEVPFTDTGWVTYAGWINRKKQPISYFSTTWQVPAAPATYNGQTVFIFNSIEPNGGVSILQPVLQYGFSAAGGGEYWGIASWYVIGTSHAFHTAVSPVSPGESLTGIIQLTQHQGKTCSYTCKFSGFSSTNLTINWISELIWATETLEVYGLNQCSDFPNTPYCQMRDIQLWRGNRQPWVNWKVTNAATSCGVQSTIVVNGGQGGSVNIYF